MIKGSDAPSIFDRPPASGVLQIHDRDAKRTELDTRSKLKVYFRGGGFTDELRVGSLCHDALGIYAGDDCRLLVARWDSIERIEVNGFDAVASLFAGIGITVGTAAALVVILVTLPPPVPVSSFIRHKDENDVVPMTVQPILTSPRPKPTPFFMANAHRRTAIAWTSSFDAGTCLGSGGETSGVRTGLRLNDFVELTGGVRWFVEWPMTGGGPEAIEPARKTFKWVGVASLAFHAELPRLRWFAFYLGFEGGSGDVPVFLSIRPGMRFALMRELAIGIYPFSPTLIAGDKEGVPKGIQAPTSLEVVATF